MKKILLFIGIIGTIFLGLISRKPINDKIGVVSCLSGQQGGTGICSATTTDIGKVLTVSTSSPFGFNLTTVSGGGASTRTSTTNYLSFYDSPTTTTGTPSLQVDSVGGLLFTNATGTNFFIGSTGRLTVSGTTTLSTTTIGNPAFRANTKLNILGGDLYWCAISGACVQFFNTASLPTSNNPQFSVFSPGGKQGAWYINDSVMGLGPISNGVDFWLYSNGSIAQVIGNLGTFRFIEGAQSSHNNNVPFMSWEPAAMTDNFSATEYTIYNMRQSTLSWQAGNLANERLTRMGATTVSAAGASTFTNVSSLAIDSAPLSGTNMTITSSTALSVGGINVANGGAVINSYGLWVGQNSGATNNWAAWFQGDINVTGTSTLATTTINNTLNIMVGGSAGQAMCWKTATTLGYCSSVVGVGGACTCN